MSNPSSPQPQPTKVSKTLARENREAPIQMSEGDAFKETSIAGSAHYGLNLACEGLLLGMQDKCPSRFPPTKPQLVHGALLYTLTRAFLKSVSIG
jgi:hypothetical protein